MANDLAEISLFWSEMTMLKEGWIITDPDSADEHDSMTIDRNIYYFLINYGSIMVTMPQIYNTCGWLRGSRQPMISQFVNFGGMFNEYIVEQAKMGMYTDTGLEMAIRGEWAITGIMAGQLLASMVHFFVLYI